MMIASAKRFLAYGTFAAEPNDAYSPSATNKIHKHLLCLGT